MSIENMPKDPMMLLSFVNTRLRDDQIDLSSFCKQFEVKEADIIDKLSKIGYDYNKELNRFV